LPRGGGRNCRETRRTWRSRQGARAASLAQTPQPQNGARWGKLLGSLSTMTGCDMDKSYFARLEMQNDRVGIK
jgi:hypothetical protein